MQLLFRKRNPSVLNIFLNKTILVIRYIIQGTRPLKAKSSSFHMEQTLQTINKCNHLSQLARGTRLTRAKHAKRWSLLVAYCK